MAIPTLMELSAGPVTGRPGRPVKPLDNECQTVHCDDTRMFARVSAADMPPLARNARPAIVVNLDDAAK